MAHVRIATFNLENLGDGPDFGTRAAVLRPQLDRLAADILCLQEVDAARTGPHAHRTLAGLDRLVAGTPYAAFHRVTSESRSGAKALDVHNLVTLSRWPVTHHRQHWNSLVPAVSYSPLTVTCDPLALAFDRPFLETAIALPGGETLHVLNLHLRAPLATWLPDAKAGPFAWKSTEQWAEGFFLAAQKRNGQALEARLAVDAIFDAAPDALVAVTGDLNAEEHEVPVRLLVAADGDTGSGSLTPRTLVPVARSIPAGNRFTTWHHGAKRQVDHILASRRLFGRFEACEAHNETLSDELVAFGRIDNPPASYHAPLVARFRL